MSAIEELVRHVVALERRCGRLEVVESVPAGGQGKRLLGLFAKALADNTPTAVFAVVTPNLGATGNAGGWTAHINAHIIDGKTSMAAAVAVKGYQGTVIRAVETTGTGVVAASEWHETASAATDAGTCDIGAVTLGAVEVSEYNVQVYLTVDHTGTAASALLAVVSVELLWYGFAIAPNLTAA